MTDPDPSTYPPLDTLKPVADGVWIVDSGPLRVFGGIPLPVRMAVVRLRGGEVAFDMVSVGATENLLMAAALAEMGLV